MGKRGFWFVYRKVAEATTKAEAERLAKGAGLGDYVVRRRMLQ